MQAQETLTPEDIPKVTAAFSSIAGESNAVLLCQLLTAALSKVSAASMHRHARRSAPHRTVMTPRDAVQEEQSPVTRDGVILEAISSKETRKVGRPVHAAVALHLSFPWQ